MVQYYKASFIFVESATANLKQRLRSSRLKRNLFEWFKVSILCLQCKKHVMVKKRCKKCKMKEHYVT